MEGKVQDALLRYVGNPLREPGRVLNFNLFSDFHIYGQVQEVHDDGKSHFYCTGSILGDDNASFLASFSNRILSVSLRGTPLGNFRVRMKPRESHSYPDNYWGEKLSTHSQPISDLTLEDDPSDTSADLIANMGTMENETSANSDSHESAFTSTHPMALARRSAVYRVDIAVVYEDNAAISAGSDSALQAMIEASLDEANDVFARSGLDMTLRLVNASSVTFNSKLDSDSDLILLTDTSDGELDNVHSLRSTVGADIVGLVVDSAGNAAGSAYTPPKKKKALQSKAFFVLSRSSLALGQYGITQFVAKTMGCAADIKSGRKPHGVFSYSRGYVFKGNDKNKYRTVVSGGGATVIPYLSTPSVTLYGKRIGNSSANNVKSMKKMIPIFAAFKGEDSAATLATTFPSSGSTFGGNALAMGIDISDDLGVDSVVIMDIFQSATQSVAVQYASPWRFYATGLDSGDHQLYAKAYDKGGHVSNSDTITVTMGQRNISSDWSEQYLGTLGRNASIGFQSDTLTVATRSKGMQKVDDVQFIYQEFSSSGRIWARFPTLTQNSGKAKAGLMFRDSLSRFGRQVSYTVHDDDQLSIMKRTSPKGSATRKTLSGTYVDTVTLMMVRNAKTITLFKKKGSAYSFISNVRMNAKTHVYGGLFFTSNDSGTIDTMSATSIGADTLSNNPPILSTSGVVEGTTYRVGDTVTLTSTPYDFDGIRTIKSVKFFSNDSLLDSATTSPFTIDLSLPLGTTLLRARVTDGVDSSENTIPIAVVDTQYRIVEPSKDTYVRDGRYQTSVYGSGQNLFARAGDANNNLLSLITFPITALDTITGATLVLYGAQSIDDSDSVQVSIFPYNDTTWAEAGAYGLKYTTYDTTSLGSEIGSFDVSGTTQAWYSVDVTAEVTAAKDSSQTAITFALQAANATTSLAVFNSRENASGSAPRLIINHN